MENENLQQNSIDDTITASSADDGSTAGAGAPEDTASAYQATISQQGDTIDALLQANERLQKQIQRMLRNGAAITDDTALQSNERLQKQIQRMLRNGESIMDYTAKANGSTAGDSGINPPVRISPEAMMKESDYEPLAALGKDIGKKPKRE